MKTSPTSKMLYRNTGIRQQFCSLSITVIKVPVKIISELAYLSGKAICDGILLINGTKFIEDDK